MNIDTGCRFSTFKADITPPLGSPVGDGALTPAKTIVDPLSARGIIIFTEEDPIVLCALDWVSINNDGYKEWCKKLAEAAGTSADRVSVHTLHPHDAPSCDFSAERILQEHGLGGVYYDSDFDYKAIEHVADVVKDSLQDTKIATHLGIGKARVNKVASNRRVLGTDGKVEHVRYSSCGDEVVRAAPEGTIDPFVRNISLWNEDEPLVSMTYYATHPQSFYGRGAVSCDFVGLARNLREATLPDVAHIHFNGAGGNVAAGKYNDGSPKTRFILSRRLAEGMEDAWEATVKLPLKGKKVEWRKTSVALPLHERLQVSEDEFLNILKDENKTVREGVRAARNLIWTRRCRQGDLIDLNCLQLGPVQILHMPGELFVEYQLKAQEMASADTESVCMAAYGDDGPGYIGTGIAYSQGGYETSQVSGVAPEVEDVLLKGLQNLIK